MNHTPRYACCLLFARLVFGSVELEYVGMLMQCLETMALAVSRREWWLNICTDSKVRMAAFAGTVEEEWKSNPPSGEGRRDTQKSVLGFISDGFLPSCVRVDCRNKSIIRRNCERDSSCLAETCVDMAGRGTREETSSIESDAEDEFCTKQAHSSIPPLMADDVHLNLAPLTESENVQAT